MSPLFIYHCPDCETDTERLRRIAEAMKPAFCEECGEQMELVPAVPSKFVRGRGPWSSPA